MADIPQLDSGFQEVGLDKGFNDVPLKKGLGDRLLDKAKSAGSAIKNGVEEIGQDTADFGRGLENGATLGAGPIINGAAEATGDKLSNLISGGEGKSWLENYRKHQQESAKNFDEADKRSPWIYGAGEVGGAVGSGLLSGGIGAEANAIKGAAGAGKLALAKQFGATALKGAGVGAAAGALGSEGTLSDAQGHFNPEGANQTAADSLGGAIGGAIAAPAMELGGKAISAPVGAVAKKISNKANELAEDSPLVRQMIKSYQLGTGGIKLDNSNPSREMQGRVQKDATDYFTNQLSDAQGKLGSQIGTSIDNAAGSKISISPEAGQAAQSIGDALSSGKIGDQDAANQAMDMLHKLSQGDNATFEPSGLKSYLPQIQSLIKSTDDPQLKSILIGLKNESEAKLESAVPGLAAGKDQYNRFMSGGPETLVNGGLNNGWLGDTRDPEGKLATGIKRILGNSESGGSASTDSLTRINDVISNLQQVEKDHPGFLDKIGFDPNAFKSEMQEAGDQFAMSKAVLGDDPKSKPNLLMSLFGGGANTGKGQLINKSNIAGRAVKSISESPVADLSRNLYNMPSETLSGIASRIKAVPGLSNLGEALENGINQKNESLKNAALFSIMQNPKARLLISGDDLNK